MSRSPRADLVLRRQSNSTIAGTRTGQTGRTDCEDVLPQRVGYNLQTYVSKMATGSSSSSAHEFSRTRFPDGYRVELIEAA